jgi:3-keto-disaccharide hydrolase
MMREKWCVSVIFLLLAGAVVAGGAEKLEEEGFVRLFPKDGVPEGWLVRHWADISKPVDPKIKWTVQEGILHGSEPRGTWLISKRQYGDFILKYDFKLGTHGNSGCALRVPLKGDPAFDGMELQMADYRYNTAAKDSELTGGIYRAIAPLKQIYKPTEWNTYVVTLKGSRLHVTLNGEVIHDLNLDEQKQEVKRHDNSLAPPVKDRPRRGHIGFQELSRGGDHARIRNARIKVLDKPSEAAPK